MKNIKYKKVDFYYSRSVGEVVQEYPLGAYKIRCPNLKVFYILDGALHKEDSPAIKYNDGSKVWFKHGKIHRLYGPAIERIDGHKEWWVNNKLHRVDGPAVEYEDGTRRWYVNDKRHRIDGPAIEWAGGYKRWYFEDKEIDCESQEEFERLIKLRALW